ncbi:MAG: SDR family oxidoreductase [Alphaproteobacteria bacterium]|nr:SDR family oxidoreductase [Alphaproteobacteria bacterium]
MQDKKLFCFGYGYSCDYLGHELQQKGGWRIAGTSRDHKKIRTLRERGIDAYMFDYERPLTDPLFILNGTTHLLISTPPDDNGDPTFLVHANDIAKIPSLEWVGYLSTTSVYGDREGGDVFETSELRPTSKRGSRRMKAEKQWMSAFKFNNLPVHIFRLSGIYGPGRSALDSVRAGIAQRINKPGHAFGRIHVEDIVQILLASMEKPFPGEAYNVCDSYHAPSHEVIEYACDLLKREPPPFINFEQANLAPIIRSFYMDNRRVQNNKILNDLGIILKYKDFKQGLKGCMEAENYALSIFDDMKQY